MENNEDFENNGKRNEAKEKAKKVVKAIVKRISLKGILLIGLIIGIMILLSGAGWFIYDDMGTWYDDEEGRPALYTKNVNMKNPQTEGIVVDKDALKKQALLDAGYTEEQIEQMTEEEKDAEIIRRYKMSEKLNRIITSLDDCTPAEILWCISPEYEKFMDKPENLEYLLNAELVTQYPYIDDLPEDKLNGVIKFYRYSNGEVNTTMPTYPVDIQGDVVIDENTGTEEEQPQESGIDASKVFYIGDSWMNGLQTWMNNNGAAYGGVKGVVGHPPSSSEFSDSSLRAVIKSDSSAIVIMLGLNGLSETEDMKSRIDFLSSNYPDKPIFVLKVPYVGKGYTRYGGADKFNTNVDTFNSAISSYCGTKSNVTFVDANSGLMNGRYLADEYAQNPSTSDGSLHLNNSGYQKWYYNIQQALKTTNQSGTTNGNQSVITNTANTEVCRLTYVTPEKFNEMLSLYNTWGNRIVFNHFTMDEEANVIVATWTKTTTTFNKTANGATVEESSYTSCSATTVTIDYKPMVKPYTLPFQYLWALLVMGEDYDFVEDLADLAYNAIIDIGIYDEVTITENIDEKTYTVTNRTATMVTNSEGQTDSKVSTTSTNYKETTVVTTETNMIKYDIAYADVWIVEIGTKYEYSETEQKPAYTSTTSIPSEGWSSPIVNTVHSQTDSVARTTTSKQTMVSDIVQTTTQNIYYKKYNRTESVVREKTDIDENTPDNFVKALRRSVNAYSLLTNQGTIEWLCGVLENNEDTVNMVDLTRYLLIKAVDPDADVQFDFSIFEPQAFSSMSGLAGGIAAGGNIGWEWTCSWENSPLWNYKHGRTNNYSSNRYIYECITQDKTQYIMHDDIGTGAGRRNFGFGVCFYAYFSNLGRYDFMHKERFAARGIDITDPQYQQYGVSKIDVEIADQVSIEIWREKKEELRKKAEAKGVQLESYQLDALVDINYQYGSGAEKAIDAYKSNGLNETAIKNSHAGFRDYGKRSEARLHLFMTGEYIAGDGSIINATSSNGTATDMQNKILEIALSKNALGCEQGWCQKWVADVYNRAGQNPRASACCATQAANLWLVSSDKNNIPIGATVYGSHSWSGTRCDNCGRDAGHVGIYIGNGLIASNEGGITHKSIESWVGTYGWRGWGWNGGTDYSK